MTKKKEKQTGNTKVATQQKATDQIMFLVNDFFMYAELSEHIENNHDFLFRFLNDVDLQDVGLKAIKKAVLTSSYQNLFLTRLKEQIDIYEG